MRCHIIRAIWHFPTSAIKGKKDENIHTYILVEIVRIVCKNTKLSFVESGLKKSVKNRKL